MSLTNRVTIAQDATGTIVAGDGTLVLGGRLDLGSGATAVFGETGNAGTIEASFTGTSATGSNALHVAGGTLIDANSTLSGITGAAGSTTVDAGAHLKYNDRGIIRELQGGGGTVESVNGLTLRGGQFAGTIEGGALTIDGKDPAGTGLDGSGNVTLSGDNTYSGGTTIATGSTLQVGAGGTTGTLGSGDVVNNGTLVFNRSDAVLVDQSISGGGSLKHDGPDLLVLSGNNSYAGSTTITSGTLQVGEAAPPARWARAMSSTTARWSSIAPTRCWLTSRSPAAARSSTTGQIF